MSIILRLILYFPFLTFSIRGSCSTIRGKIKLHKWVPPQGGTIPGLFGFFVSFSRYDDKRRHSGSTNEEWSKRTKPQSRKDVIPYGLVSGTDSSTSVQTTETRLADLLDSTLWNRRLAPSSERIVYALVQQIFHGIREYFLASAELKVTL